MIRSLRRALMTAVVLAACLPATAGAVEVQRVESPGGLTAWLVENHATPVVSVKFAFRGGSALDPEGKSGLAALVAALLDEGAGKYGSVAFRKKLEAKAIRMNFSAGRDRFRGSLRTLTRHRDTAFRLLRLALTEPRFDAEPVERIRGQRLSSLQDDRKDPGVRASREFMHTLFPDHPYRRRPEGTVEGVKAVTVKDMKAFVRRRLARDNLILGVAGDITPEALAGRLDDTFGALPAEAAPWRLPPGKPRGRGAVKVVEQAVPQTVGVFGHRGIARDDPDYYAAKVVNHILGGSGLTSRLMQTLRDDKGLAYGVYSSLIPFDRGPLILGRVATRNAQFGKSMDLIRKAWRDMAENGPTRAELEDARRYLTGSFPLRFDSTAKVANMLVGMQVYDLGIDYLDRRNDLIEQVDMETARRVAGELYKPGALALVAAGRPEGLDAGSGDD